MWVCWFQGMDSAPELVQKCYTSLQNNLSDREIVLLTEENFRDYTDLPKHILEKYEAGKITLTHFSDILRMDLLSRLGGTWIDATVLCTSSDIPSYMLDSDLFFFQTLQPGSDGSRVNFSSWFITSTTNNPLILLTRDLLYEYWRTHDSLIEYFLVHFFMQIAIETFPDEYKKVFPFSNEHPHIILLNLFEQYNGEWYENVLKIVPFHKLSYKVMENDITGTNFEHILNS